MKSSEGFWGGWLVGCVVCVGVGLVGTGVADIGVGVAAC